MAAAVKKNGTMRVKNPKPLKSIAARYHHLVFHHATKVGSEESMAWDLPPPAGYEVA